MRFIAPFLLAMCFGTAAQSQSSADICAANVPQFPQACGCIVSQMEAQGIPQQFQDRLLANDVVSVPIDLFQSYGLIFTQCIQQSVMGTAPQVPAPLPVPAEPEIATPVPSTPTQPPIGAGTWGAGQAILRHAPPQRSADVRANDGRLMRVFCDPRSGSYLMLDGVEAGPGIVFDVAFAVTRGDGSIYRETTMSMARIEGGRLITEASNFHLDALAAGAQLRISSPAHGVDMVAGLSGSSRAIRDLGCRERGAYTQPPLVLEYTGDWLAYAPTPGSGGALATLALVAHDGIGLACGDHLHLPLWRGANSNRDTLVRVTIDDDPALQFMIALGFNRGSAIAWEVPDGFFRSVRSGTFLRIEDVQNGQQVEAIYDLAGLEPALQQIGCAEDAGTALPPPPDGWHNAVSYNEWGNATDAVRLNVSDQVIEFSCLPGSPLGMSIGPITGYRVLSAPARLTVGEVSAEVPANLDGRDIAALAPSFEVDQALLTGETLAILIPAFGVETVIQLAEPRALWAALQCAPANAPEPIDPDFAGIEFGGVDDQPWQAVQASGLGQLMVHRPDESPEFNLHIGCGGRLAFDARAYPHSGDTLPVSFNVITEEYPRPAIDFARQGDWRVADDPRLVADLREAVVFGYAHLTENRPQATLGNIGLADGLQATCGG